jgi:SAM-dependent methyltransferase
VDIVSRIIRHLPIVNSFRLIANQYLNYIPTNPFSDSIIPPKRLTYIYGLGDFIAIGRESVKSFIELCDLKPTDTVLDIGCGIGRIAIPLTEYLSSGGSYEGFDVIPYGIKWCKKRIEPRFPNFHFQLANIYNSYYNPKGRFKPTEYSFPYNDNAFDFVCAISVMTHMLTKDLDHYLSEIRRVLKKNTGKAFITYFLLNPKTFQLMKEGKSHFSFKFKLDEYCYTIDEARPELDAAYDESFIRNLYEKHGLKIIEPIRYGSWRVGEEGFEFQDAIISLKN